MASIAPAPIQWKQPPVWPPPICPEKTVADAAYPDVRTTMSRLQVSRETRFKDDNVISS